MLAQNSESEGQCWFTKSNVSFEELTLQNAPLRLRYSRIILAFVTLPFFVPMVSFLRSSFLWFEHSSLRAGSGDRSVLRARDSAAGHGGGGAGRDGAARRRDVAAPTRVGERPAARAAPPQTAARAAARARRGLRQGGEDREVGEAGDRKAKDAEDLCDFVVNYFRCSVRELR